MITGESGRSRDDTARRRRGALVLLDGLVDALWRAPVRRPGGPIRLLYGPRRPAEGRLIGGVCGALAGDAPNARLLLRILFVLFLSFGTLLL